MKTFKKWLAEARLPIKDDYKVLPGFKFGIEIEGVLPLEENLEEFLEVLKIEQFIVDRDLSVKLRFEGEKEKFHPMSLEIKTPGDGVPSDYIESVLQDLTVLENFNFHLNKTAGIHVHVSSDKMKDRNIPLSVMLNIVSMLDEPQIYKILKYREDHIYARSTRKELAKLLRDPHIKENPTELKRTIFGLARSSSVNFDALLDHGTVEFRLFGALGKIDVEKHVSRWVRYLSNLFEKAWSKPYEMGGLSVRGDMISYGKELLKPAKERGSGLDDADYGPLMGIVNKFSQDSNLTQEGLDRSLELISGSRYWLLKFVKLLYFSDLFIPVDLNGIETLFGLFFKFGELDGLNRLLSSVLAGKDKWSQVRRWSKEKTEYVEQFTRYAQRLASGGAYSPAVHHILNGILDGIQEKGGSLTDKTLEDLGGLSLLMIVSPKAITHSYHLDAGEIRDTMDRFVQILRDHGRDDIAKGLISKVYKRDKGHWVDELKEKEKSL